MDLLERTTCLKRSYIFTSPPYFFGTNSYLAGRTIALACLVPRIWPVVHSYLVPCTSYLVPRSYLVLRTWYLVPRASHYCFKSMPLTPYLTSHTRTSYLVPSYLPPGISNLVRRPSLVLRTWYLLPGIPGTSSLVLY